MVQPPPLAVNSTRNRRNPHSTLECAGWLERIIEIIARHREVAPDIHDRLFDIDAERTTLPGIRHVFFAELRSGGAAPTDQIRFE